MQFRVSKVVESFEKGRKGVVPKRFPNGVKRHQKAVKNVQKGVKLTKNSKKVTKRRINV